MFLTVLVLTLFIWTVLLVLGDGDVINLEPGVSDSGQLNNPIISVGGTFVQVQLIGGTTFNQLVSIAVLVR